MIWKVVGEENLFPGPDGKDDPFLIRTWLENSQKYPETLEPEETAGPSTEKATTYASQPSPDFKIRNDTNSQPVNRSNLQWSGKKLRKGGKSITLIGTACQSDNSTLRTKL